MRFKLNKTPQLILDGSSTGLIERTNMYQTVLFSDSNTKDTVWAKIPNKELVVSKGYKIWAYCPEGDTVIEVNGGSSVTYDDVYHQICIGEMTREQFREFMTLQIHGV